MFELFHGVFFFYYLFWFKHIEKNECCHLLHAIVAHPVWGRIQHLGLHTRRSTLGDAATKCAGLTQTQTITNCNEFFHWTDDISALFFISGSPKMMTRAQKSLYPSSVITPVSFLPQWPQSFVRNVAPVCTCLANMQKLDTKTQAAFSFRFEITLLELNE